MKFNQRLISGRLLKRYKRFLADVQLDSGEIITAHCPNTGGMLGCQDENSRVWLRYAPSPKRKLDYSWELASDQEHWVGIYSARANDLVEEAWQAGLLNPFADYRDVKREVKAGGSRLDFLFSSPIKPKVPDCYVEVKSVTASTETGLALFPDAKTQRGLKHLHELMLLKQQGYRVAMLFCLQRADCQQLRTAPEFDPEYAHAFELARSVGVEAYAYACEVTPEHIRIDKAVEILMTSQA